MKQLNTIKKQIFIVILFCKSLCLFGQQGNNWMSYLNPNTNIANITIPGSHDTGAYGEADLSRQQNLFPRSTYITQDLSFYEQLNKGIRFFDIRLKESDTHVPGDPIIVHGDIKFHTRFKRDVLGDVKRFFRENQKEALIMTIQSDQGSASKLANELNNIMNDPSYRDLFFTDNRFPKLQELKSKILLITRSLNNVAGINYSPVDNVTSVANTNPYIKVNNYYNLGTDSCLSWPFTNCDVNKDRKWGRVKELMEEADNNRYSNRLYLNAVNGYTSKKIAQIPTPIPDITDVSDYMNPRVINYMKKIDKSYGVLILDWVNTSLIEAIYKVNFDEWAFDTRAVLYQDSNFKGDAIRIKGDDAYLGSSGQNFNDKISSVKVISGYEYFGYENSNYSGKYVSLRGNVSYISGGLNDEISSMYWLSIPNAVHFYEDVNFTDDGSRPTSFTSGSYDDSLTNTSVGNDEISSLRIPPNWTVRMYRDANYSDGWIQFRAGSSGWYNISDITDHFSSWNDEVSSVKIWDYRYDGRGLNNSEVGEIEGEVIDKYGNTIAIGNTKRPKVCSDCNEISKSVSMYPNPVRFHKFDVVINTSINEKAELKIHNVLGELVYKQSLDLIEGMNRIPIDISDFRSKSKGVYVVEIESLKGVRLSKKLLIK
ncbi:Por secretion system C-terminal sorting domain-containing protein [Tenacibaculum sp. MAR_2009_124]|uniref:phosphatidylinositol-specific phospholipase C domain-containing protein n=1 Tax=Tenacibaculum sp. MAR_2009_124 TaxID=1250059 RepID=UPI00089A410E|nr:phosphatidylinositol-specific phospholipase C domain-containing protein [Tenacibaculum sp. MAR_2009_124]SEC92761.1 Por secretion system C-terminal sorting domain-containing protein [Tenacibaculum sp. MAR_2009_124]